MRFNSFIKICCLLILGILLTYRYLGFTEIGLTSLVTRGNISNISYPPKGELLNEGIIKGSFISKYDYLNALSFRFTNYGSYDKTRFFFQIKEQRSPYWYFSQGFNGELCNIHKLCTFSFPEIKDSQNKEYIFEIQYFDGGTGQTLLIDSHNSIFLARSNHWQKINFWLYQKIINTFEDNITAKNISSFFLPLAAYLIFLLCIGASFSLVTHITIAAILYSVFYSKANDDWLLISTAFFWWLNVLHHKIEPKVTVLIGIIVYLCGLVNIVFGRTEISERLASWFVIMSTLSIMQFIYFNKKKIDIKINSLSFISGLQKISVSKGHWSKNLPRWANYGLILTFLTIIFLYMASKLKTVYSFFKIYNPGDYDSKFLASVTLPLVTLATVFVITYLYFKKYFKNTYLSISIFILGFIFIFNIILNKSLLFQNEPKILSVSPRQTSEAWTDVTITGKNFRDIPFIGSVYIDGVEQLLLISWSDEKVVFRTNPDNTKSGNLYIVPFEREKTNHVPFNYSFKR